MDSHEVKSVRLADLKREEGSEELAGSSAMRPYIRLAKAILTERGVDEALAEIAKLPLEDRYVWRVVSALKWAFADFDSTSVTADRNTLRPEDRQQVAELLRFRPVQFCMFLKAVAGEEAMEQVMTDAIKAAKG